MHSFVIENPGSTLLYRFDVVSDLAQWTGAQKVRTYMGAFSSEYSKPIDLLGTFPHLQAMRRPRPVCAKSLVTRCGKQVNGKSKELTASAACTYEFGDAFACACIAYWQGKPMDSIANQPKRQQNYKIHLSFYFTWYITLALLLKKEPFVAMP